MGITIYVRPENAVGMLPAPIELTWTEQVVLYACRSLKSSYAGISNYRLHEATRETGITGAEYELAKASLISRKLGQQSRFPGQDARDAA